MAYEAILNTEIEVDDAITQSLMQKIKDNFDFFNSSIGGGQELINNSFDIDSDGDGEPDSWGITLYPGGSSDLDATNAEHGAFALKFVHPSGGGNGGGNALSDYIPCNENYPFFIEFLHKCSQSGVKNIIQAIYYTEGKVYIAADDTIYEKTTNPTIWEVVVTSAATIPSTAQYCKIRIIGGFTDADPGSSTNIWFDNILIDYNVYTSNGASLGDFIVYDEGGDNAGGSDALAGSGLVGATPTKVAEANILYPGEVDVRMYVDDNGGTGKARIYVNGSPVGTEHTFGTPSAFEDLAIAVEVGDLLQVYGYGAAGDGMFLNHITVHSVKRAPVLGGFEYFNL